MDISFRSGRLQKICNSEKQSQKALGKKGSSKLQQRMMELSAASTLGEISHLPPPRCHELRNRKGVFSVDLEYPKRLLLIPIDDPIPLRADGGIDLDNVTEIEIIDIEDTHDKKNQRSGKKKGKKK